MSDPILPLIKDRLIYNILQIEDIDEAVHCITKIFINHEPMTHVLKFTEKEFIAIASDIVNIGLDKKNSGMGIVARCSSTQRIAGVTVGKAFSLAMCDTKEEITGSKFDPIAKLLGDLNRAFYAAYPEKIHDTFVLYVRAVDNAYLDQHYLQNRPKNIGSHFGTLMTQFAQQRGFSTIFSHATNIKTQRIWEKQGGKEIARVNYEDFVFKDKRVFKSITEPPGCCILFAKDL